MAQAAALAAFAAELLTPLSPVAKTVGTALAASVIGAGAWLIWSQRRVDRAPSRDLAVGANLAHRTPVATAVVFLGVLVFAGVWTDPTRHRDLFVAVWAVVLFLTAVVLCFAGFDLLTVNRRAYERRIALVEESRRRLRAEVAEYQRRRNSESSPPTDDPLGPPRAHG
jgi:hypothetical protein